MYYNHSDYVRSIELVEWPLSGEAGAPQTHLFATQGKKLSTRRSNYFDKGLTVLSVRNSNTGHTIARPVQIGKGKNTSTLVNYFGL